MNVTTPLGLILHPGGFAAGSRLPGVPLDPASQVKGHRWIPVIHEAASA